MSKSSIHFIVQKSPANEEQFQEKLQALSEKRSFYAPSIEDVPPVLQELQQYEIRQCVVSSKHIAFLLEDGRVCRVKYFAHDPQEEPEIEATTTTATSGASKSTSTSKTGERPPKLPRTGSTPWIISGTDLSSGHSSALRRWGTHIGVIRSIASSSATTNSSSVTSASTTTARHRARNSGSDAASSLSASGVRLVRTSQLRGRGLQSSLLTGQRVIVPASHVPEELVNQVQGILQGKSRSIITRELQRTNLDVNLAVNNLLSRDDEDNDDMDDNGSDYIPSEDLLSLLDSGIHPGEHGVFIDSDAILPDELLGYTFQRAPRISCQRTGASGGDGASGGGGASARDVLQDRDPIIRLRAPRFLGYESDQDDSSQKSKSNSGWKRVKVSKECESVNLAEQLEWWMDDGEYVKFIQIGSMQSELAAIDETGNLRQWRWGKDIPYRHPTNQKIFHPRTQFLGIEDKKVVHLAACTLRATVLVENGGVATWIDKTVSKHASVLEHHVTNCVHPDLAMEFGTTKHDLTRDRCLHICSLYSALFTSSGEVYWWGVLPFHLRKHILSHAQAKLKKTLASGKSKDSKKNEVTVGSMVCLHSCPMFQAGATAIHVRGGKPKVGCLQQSAWNLTDKCTFKILTKRKHKKSKTKEKERKKTDKKKGDGKGILEHDLTPKSEEMEAVKNETPVIQSNSERETVLKSTSSTPIIPSTSVDDNQSSQPSKPQKRKLSSSKSNENLSGESKSKTDKDETGEKEQEEAEIEEQWDLQDVIFVEDVQTIPVGKVLKVDGDMIAVWFSKSGKFKEKTGKSSIMKNLRLLRKEDVYVLPSGNPPKAPECFLRAPGKLNELDRSFKLHSICINELGIQAIEGGVDGAPMSHLQIDLTGKITSDCPFPSPPEMFFDDGNMKENEMKHDDGIGKSICKLDRNCQDFPTIFRDRNSSLYPLLRNENSGFRDPRWLNITPLSAVGTGSHVSYICNNPLQNKNKVSPLVVTALVFKSSLLIPMLVRRDLKSVKETLEILKPDEIQALCDERCDGQRNIIHVAVSTTAPSPNRDHDGEEETDQKKEDTADDDRKKKDKDSKKPFRFFKPLDGTNTETTATSTPATESSNEVSNARSSAPADVSQTSSRTSTLSHSMSQSERVNAATAIANAISVVTRGERTGPPSVASERTRFMRDIMQQFADVLDDHPSSSSAPTSSTTVSTSVSQSSASSHRRIPTIIREGRQSSSVDEPMEVLQSPYRSSPTPAIPTLSWPPDPTSFSPLPLPSWSREEGLNLSVTDSNTGVTSSSRYTGAKPSSKRAKRKRSITPPVADVPKPLPKRGTQADGIAIVKTLCTAKSMQPVILKLLSQRDALGHTPFMSAIYNRAYSAAMEIFLQVQAIAAREYLTQHGKEEEMEIDSENIKFICHGPKYEEILMSMIFPKASDLDNNPLYVLLTNDTCSFTWTGANHINQDIFECWTCGLTGTLCCCSECARVCHKGHQCKLKKTSPTAYCDCWEKCACRSLMSGETNFNDRNELVQKLLSETNLVDLSNARGETMLQFLAHTVARQTVEQRQHRPRSNASSSRANRSAKSTIPGVEYDVPQHDLLPPTFCRDAFLLLLHDWKSVKATIMSNSPGHMDPLCASSLPDQIGADLSPLLLPEEEECMSSQTGTSKLDMFTLCLLVKCNTMYLDMLLETLISRIQETSNSSSKNEDLEVVHRFVRSVVRVFVVLSVCTSSENQSGKQIGRNMSNSQPLKRAQRAFNALLPMAVGELCEMATALIDPVRMGVARPTLKFPVLPSSSDAIQGCESAFSRVPFPPRDRSEKKKKGDRRRLNDGSTSSSISAASLTTPRPSSRGNFARRGISHRRSRNFGSPRANTDNGGSNDANGHERVRRIAQDVIQNAFADDLVRINRRARNEMREYSSSFTLEEDNNFEILSDEEEDVHEPRDWQIVESSRENNEQEERTQENTSQSSTIQTEESQSMRNSEQDDHPIHDENQEDNMDDDNVQRDEMMERTESQTEVVSEGDLDVDDEDQDTQENHDHEEDEDNNNHDDEESDMELTLLAASDADTDQDSNQSGQDEEVISEEDIGDDDEDDDDDQDEEEEDRNTYVITSGDEAATATDLDEEDGSSQDDDDVIDEEAGDQDEGDNEDEEEQEVESPADWVEFPLERAPTRLQRSRAAMAPHSMRWALGQNPNPGRGGATSSGSRTSGPGSNGPGSGLMYIDPHSLWRGNNSGVNSTPNVSASGDSSKQSSGRNSHSASTTNAQLARAFGICVREMASLLIMLWQKEHIVNTPLLTFLELTFEDVQMMNDFVEATLSPTWKWLLTVIDSTEAQLRYGQVLSLAGSPDHIEHPLYKGPGKSPNRSGAGKSTPDTYRRGGGGAPSSTRPSSFLRLAREASTDSNAARQDFLSYILSLMRAHSGEHADYLPVMDVSSLRHVAYVLDALVYFLRETAPMFDDDSKGNKKKFGGLSKSDANAPKLVGSTFNIGYDNTDDEDEDDVDLPPPVERESSTGISVPQEKFENTDELYSLAVSDVIVGDIIANAQEVADPTIPFAQPQKCFFRRSDSMSFLGCSDPDPFMEPLVKALPLADKPHLLQPNARKEELFGRPRQRCDSVDDAAFFDPDLPGTGMGQLRHKMPAKFEKLEEIRERMKEKKSGLISIGVQTEDEVAETQANTEEQLGRLDAQKLDDDKNSTQPMEVSDTKEETISNIETDLAIMAPPAQTVIVKTETQKTKDQPANEIKKIQPSKKRHFTPPSVDSLLGRCRLTLELFTKVFLNDVGAEPKSILQDLGGFEVREAKFRKEMEKLRNSQSVDLQLNVEREPHRLIVQTFKQLNQHYRRRSGMSSSSLSSSTQPLAVQRVKVIFKEEPGEGSGVARSFYTALCEALLSSDQLPPLDGILVPLGSSSSRNSSGIHHSLVSRLRRREQERERDRSGRAGGRKINLRSYFMARYAQRSNAPTTTTTSTSGPSTVTSSTSSQISALSPPFYKRTESRRGDSAARNVSGGWSLDKRVFGDRLLPKVIAINPMWPEKITGMLLSLPVSELLLLLSSDTRLNNKVNEAARRLTLFGYTGEEDAQSNVPKDGHGTSSNETNLERSPRNNARMSVGASNEKSPPGSSPLTTKEKVPEKDLEYDSDHEEEEVDISTFPLFYQPGKRGFYSPAAGSATKKTSSKSIDSETTRTTPKKPVPLGYEARLNAFRNVGRIIGLCLLQNELCPLPLNRHILKALLGRKINWHDFAFFDPVMYESMRFVLAENEKKSDNNVELLNALDLTFVANPLPEEGGGEVELIPGGSSISVTPSNLRDYVRRYTTYRMITCCHKYIKQMKEGLFDVLPRSSLDGLTAEDLRLLANGCGRVNVHTLISYTSFNDESGKSAGSNAEKLTEFKRWFWSVVLAMNHSSRQELLYFWTGSPALPASEDGFQPMPTVTIRPPDDQHLPTANTCISRLYVPFYSTRVILKQKLMIAIKTKNFGFV
uniref:E3 ubiquitin-protein ligase UBR5-like isoform X3 n=1 Tax=Styela clava TaxID=7725 RepID=UPI001939895F|nr:E3 ubiquitin-protein ligase UBR5-like isoform X3 [Styela clava]